MSPEEVADALGELKGLFSDKSLDFFRNRKKGGASSSSRSAQGCAGSTSRATTTTEASGDTTSSARPTPRPAAMSAQEVSELASGVADEPSLHAAVASMPTYERAKHGWMADLDAASSSTVSKSPTAAKATGPSSSSSSSSLSSSPHLAGTLLDDGPGTSDAGGQRFDLNGWPLLFPTVAAKTTAVGGEATTKASKSTSSAAGAKETAATEDENEAGGDVPLHLGLHHHGQEPSHPGYTIDELCLLSRSLNSPQRALAANALARALATTVRVLRATSAAHARSQVFNGRHGSGSSSSSNGVGGANEALLRQLRPLRVPVQLPSLCCQLLSDVSVAVRAAACLLANALFDADAGGLVAGASAWPSTSSSLSSSSSSLSSSSSENVALGGGSSSSSSSSATSASAWTAVPEPGLEAWRTHLGVTGPPLSPWRKLVSGQAVLAQQAATNLRRLAWEHPQRLDDEEGDDDSDEHARLVRYIVCVCATARLLFFSFDSVLVLFPSLY